MQTTTQVIKALGALAQETRLAMFRMLVQAGPEGLPAGEIAGRLGLAAPAASFHLTQLSHARLARSRSQGRFVIYSADFEQMAGLVAFLTENCCGGDPCGPVSVTCPPVRKGTKR
jgi:DNA-binding transcriptional ArsR family regulator